MSFFLGSWGMNRSAEQTNRPRTASRFTRFVCPALRFIPHEPRKKDTHFLNIPTLVQAGEVAYTAEDKCDLLNGYFCSVTDVDNRDKDLPRFDDRTDSTMSNFVVSEQDIVDVIEVIDPKKKPPDQMISVIFF